MATILQFIGANIFLIVYLPFIIMYRKRVGSKSKTVLANVFIDAAIPLIISIPNAINGYFFPIIGVLIFLIFSTKYHLKSKAV